MQNTLPHNFEKPSLWDRLKAGRMTLWFSACLILFSILPIALLGYFAVSAAEDAAIAKTKADLAMLSASKSKAVAQYFRDRTRTASAIADMPYIADFIAGTIDRKLFSERFEPVIEKTDFPECFIFASDGTLQYSTKIVSGIRSIADKIFENTQILEAYRRTADSGRLSLSGLGSNNIEKVPNIFIGCPVYAGEEFRGICVFSIDLSRIVSMIASEQPELCKIQICSFENNLPRILGDAQGALAITQQSPFWYRKGAPFLNAETGSAGVLGELGDGKPAVIAWDYVPIVGWYVVSCVNLQDALWPMPAMRFYLPYILGAVALAALFVGHLMSRMVLTPVQRLIRVSGRLLGGNFEAAEVVSAHMEFKTLANNFAQLAHAISSFLKNISLKCADLISGIKEIMWRTKDRITALARTENTASEVYHKAVDISMTSKALKETISTVLAVSEQTVINAEGGLVHIEKIEGSMTDLKSFSTELMGQLKDLYGNAQIIERVVETMESVADKTNLLSLNAAIEAKKAGEFGKGFSVVASEIGRLATQTANSAIEIERGISGMVAGVNNGLEGMDTFAKKVESSYADMMVVSKHLSGIIQQVQGLPTRLESALDGVNGQSSAAMEIREGMGKLKDEIAQIMSSVSETEKLATRMKFVADSLKTEISRYKF